MILWMSGSMSVCPLSVLVQVPVVGSQSLAVLSVAAEATRLCAQWQALTGPVCPVSMWRVSLSVWSRVQMRSVWSSEEDTISGVCAGCCCGFQDT